VGIVLGGFWAQEHLGGFWGWDPREIGGVCVVAWYCLMILCLRYGRVGGVVEMLMGVAGNVVGSMTWFGVTFVFAFVRGSRVHSYAPVWTVVALVAAFVVVQLAIMGMAIVPPGRLARRRA
jgi:hypothetical protein